MDASNVELSIRIYSKSPAVCVSSINEAHLAPEETNSQSPLVVQQGRVMQTCGEGGSGKHSNTPPSVPRRNTREQMDYVKAMVQTYCIRHPGEGRNITAS